MKHPDCFHECTGNCRHVGCNCECGEFHDTLEEIPVLKGTLEALDKLTIRPQYGCELAMTGQSPKEMDHSPDETITTPKENLPTPGEWGLCEKCKKPWTFHRLERTQNPQLLIHPQ